MEFFYHIARIAEVGGNVLTWVSTWQPHDKRAQACRRQLLFWLQTGLPLADAMRRTRMFDHLESSLVALGESSGALPKILSMLAESREFQIELRKKLKEELFMPAIELFAAFVAVVIVLFFVFPKFEGFLASAGLLERVPEFSRQIFQTAGFLRKWGGPALLGFILLGILGVRWLKQNYVVLLRFPVVGNVVRFRLYSLLFLYLSMLVESGVSLPRCFLLIEKSFTNDPLVSRIARRIRGWLERDYGLAYAFQAVQRQTPIFSRDVLALVSLGEGYGQLSTVAQRAARMYSAEFERSMKLLAKAATPATLVVIVGLVICLIIGIMVPIFQMAFSFAGG